MAVKMRTIRISALIASGALAACLLEFGGLIAGHAQDVNKGGGFPPAGTPGVLPRPDFHFPGNVGRTCLDSDPPQFPQPVHAPKGAPNIVLILIDDAGFGQFSTFEGGVPSPTMDKLAAREKLPV